MNKLIINMIYKDKEPSRKSIGYLSALTGAFCNVFLFVAKITIGLTINSISITADGFNNLSDLGTNLISFIGFKYADKPADKNHPFGHGRFEYISAMIISIIIILFSYELIKNSIGRIINPQPINSQPYVIFILVLSIIVKLWMAAFNKKLNEKIQSQNLNAVFFDSIADVFATSLVIISIIFNDFSLFSLDGAAGVIVALFIGYTGVQIFKDTLNSLIGTQPETELSAEIKNYILDFDGIQGVHDLIIHDYGPETKIATIHTEMSSCFSFIEAHNIIDNIENSVKEKYDINLLIHVDPIDNSCIDTIISRDMINQITDKYKSIINIHDFRVVNERGKKVVIFDMVVDIDLSDTDIENLRKEITNSFMLKNKGYRIIINIEKEDVFIHG
jgi:cation diffusion facilitator family transporter